MTSAHTVFVLIAAALVMMMTPALGLFYGGMVRSKNVLGTIMHSFIILAIISVEWVLWGYSLAFGPDVGGVIGNLSLVGLHGVGLDPNPSYAPSVPQLAFMIFQCMFAAITPALITGAFAERIKFSGFLLFTVLWATLVYDPLAHWVWGVGGWMKRMGALDFAGGTVIHISSGAAALAAVMVIGKRRGYGRTRYIPHNLPMTLTGAALLWFGWFGFNAGSALACDGLAVHAFVATHLAASAAAMAWGFMEWKRDGKPTTLGVASGAVAGLVAITPACGFVGPLSALLIGMVAGGLCYYGIMMKARFGYDDALDVVGIHGLGGAWGALATGFFASKAINPGGNNGLFFGNPTQVLVQLVSVVVSVVFSFVMTFIILMIVERTVGLRLTAEEEEMGLDVALHSETGYNF